MHRSRSIFVLPLAPLLLWAGAALAEAELRLTPQQAVRRALQHNLSLKVDRLDPALTRSPEQAADAAFDTLLFGGVDVSGSPGSVSTQRVGLEPTSSTSVGGDVGVRKRFSIGTTVEGNISSSALFGGGSRGGLDPAYQSGVNLSVRQALLQGVSRRANEAPITSARLEREAATAMLSRRAELVAVDTLKAYWDLRAAVARVEIQRVALEMSEQTLRETEALIGGGKLSASERASAAYAVQGQRRASVVAEQQLSNVRDRMARILGLVAPSSLATPLLVPASRPGRRPPGFTLAELQRQALSQRGDFKALKIEIELQRLTEQTAQHGLLPQLDLVGGLQLTGLSGEPGDGSTAEGYDRGYWSSYLLKRVGWSAGLALEVPLGNAQARAEREIAALRARRATLSVELAVQELSLELNVAWRTVQAAREQLRLTEEAARVAELKLENETARYKAGKITAHILGAVQAEVVTERLGREQALADLVKAVVELRAAAGVLLAHMKLNLDGEVRR